MIGTTPESSLGSDKETDISPEDDRRIEALVNGAGYTYTEATSMVVGGEDGDEYEDENTPSRHPGLPEHRQAHARGHVRDFSGRGDEYRGGPGAPAPGFEGAYAVGIPRVMAAARESRLTQHRNPTKTDGVLLALEEIGLAKSAASAARIFGEEDLDDPARARLGRYRDSDHAQELFDSHQRAADEAIARACAECALRFSDCFLKDRPHSFNRHFQTPEAREALRSSVKRTGTQNVDFNCSDSAKTN